MNIILKKVLNDSGLSFDCEIGLKPLVYIAGPFASDPVTNTENAVKVGSIATNLGLAPVIPHTTIISNAYGRDEHKCERDSGMMITLSILTMVASDPNAHLWVIQNDNGTLSQGTQLEYDLWRELRYDFPHLNVTIKTYRDWLSQRVITDEQVDQIVGNGNTLTENDIDLLTDWVVNEVDKLDKLDNLDN